MNNQLENNIPKEFPNFVIFKIDNAKVNIDVFFQDETLWLTQKQLAELFETTPQNITLHLKNIYQENELDINLTCKDFLQVQKEGNTEVKRNRKYYNLKAVTAVGYRVNSPRATEFRKWATEVLHEYIIKGFTMDDERLKEIHHFGIDYFEEQIERVREIRLSERRFLELSDYPLLLDKGKVSALEAKLKAESEYEKYRVVQDKLYQSDFDKLLENIQSEEKL